MKKSILYVLILFAGFAYAQNVFPVPTGNAVLGNGNNLFINGGVIRNNNAGGTITIDDTTTINGSLQVSDNIQASGGVTGDHGIFDEIYSGKIEIMDNMIDMIYPATSSWKEGIDFYKEKKPSLIKWGGIGATGNLVQLNRLYMTHGSNPQNSILGINILTNGNVGIGTLSPTTTLEINAGSSTFDPLGNSGLKLTQLTSGNSPTKGAMPIGVDSTGKVVRVDVGSSSGGWLLTGNPATNPSINFLGTTDSQPLVIKTNNTERLKINISGRFVFHNSDTTPVTNLNLYLGGGNDPVSLYPAGQNVLNTVVGLGSLKANTSGYKNTIFGANSLYKNTTGYENSVVGVNSMINNTTGNLNIVIGNNSMNTGTTSIQNVVVGNNALVAATTAGNYNVALGNGTLNKVTTGQYNIHLGYYTATTGITTGTRNIGIGYNAGKNLTTGSNNIMIGSENLTVTPNIVINAPISNSASNQLNIGNWIYGHNGKIAIGNFTNVAQVFSNIENANYQLIVKNGIKTEKVRVELASTNDWADYVFNDDYDLMNIDELEKFILKNKHLPNIPTASEVMKDGIDLGEMDAKLLEKIEELTLYSIGLYKENYDLKEETKNLQKENQEQQILLEELLKRVEQLESNK
ncbi:cell division protein ZapB [Moheibacter sediminis]|uniref:Chaperone of endosialidase n=1 Tax=Moheibacter sediminis TaxID=1434700 RepID=A0A1W1ZCF5_9FLAO|nr:cell division protein ZapB [Moheibacter sediminis]SMC46105.1 hypothetical protein SAMN06296427_102385 [Moheibacter sediminis]